MNDVSVKWNSGGADSVRLLIKKVADDARDLLLVFLGCGDRRKLVGSDGDESLQPLRRPGSEVRGDRTLVRVIPNIFWQVVIGPQDASRIPQAV